MLNNNLIYLILQVLLLIFISPLISGIIKKTKAICQFRKGVPLFQPYYDLIKYFKKDCIISDNASWIFKITPYILLTVSIVLIFFIPIISYQINLSNLADIFFIIYLFALMRFFLTLSALDTASAFGGMASSREMMLSVIIEPALILVFISIATVYKTTNLSNIIAASLNDVLIFKAENFLLFLALFIIIIAETGRVPFDNPATHLELTMIHEGMILEYSGKYLTMVTLSLLIKQAILFTIVINIFFPFYMLTNLTFSNFIVGSFIYLIKIFIFSIIVGLFESFISKFRLFQLPDLASIAFVLSLVSIVINIL